MLGSLLNSNYIYRLLNSEQRNEKKLYLELATDIKYSTYISSIFEELLTSLTDQEDMLKNLFYTLLAHDRTISHEYTENLIQSDITSLLPLSDVFREEKSIKCISELSVKSFLQIISEKSRISSSRYVGFAVFVLAISKILDSNIIIEHPKFDKESLKKLRSESIKIFNRLINFTDIRNRVSKTDLYNILRCKKSIDKILTSEKALSIRFLSEVPKIERWSPIYIFIIFTQYYFVQKYYPLTTIESTENSLILESCKSPIDELMLKIDPSHFILLKSLDKLFSNIVKNETFHFRKLCFWDMSEKLNLYTKANVNQLSLAIQMSILKNSHEELQESVDNPKEFFKFVLMVKNLLRI